VVDLNKDSNVAKRLLHLDDVNKSLKRKGTQKNSEFQLEWLAASHTRLDPKNFRD